MKSVTVLVPTRSFQAERAFADLFLHRSRATLTPRCFGVEFDELFNLMVACTALVFVNWHLKAPEVNDQANSNPVNRVLAGRVLAIGSVDRHRERFQCVLL